MTWTARKKLGGYGGVPGLKIRITQPGSATSLTSPAMIPMTEIADELFAAEIPDNLVGHFEYRIFRVDSPIWDGWLRRYPNQSSVILDDPRAISDITSDDASTPFPVGGGLTFPELHGGVFPQPAQVEVGVIYGPLGNDKTGTLVAASGGQTEILNAIAALGMEGEFAISRTFVDGSTPVQGVRMSIVGTGLFDFSDAFGVARINAGIGQYTIRMTAPTGFAPIDDQPVAIIDAINTGEIALTRVGPPTATAETTELTFRVSSQGNASLAGIVASARLPGEGAIVTGATLAINVVETAESNEAGVVTLVLFRNTEYDLSVQRTNGTIYKTRIRTAAGPITTIADAIEV